MITNPFEQVEAACREFRQSWKKGKPRSIEEVLSQFDETAHVTVFRNLLSLEIEFRRRAKRNPTAEEYSKRFPQFAHLIRQAFFQSTMMSMQASLDPPMTPSDFERAADRTVSLVIPAANQLGDYHLLEEIGRGGFGVVYKARHQQRQNVVALKTLPIGEDRLGQGDAERLHKFRREFRSLADVNHPNLVGMQTLEVDGAQWFFTMDLLDGDDFIGYVRPQGKLDEERLRATLPQLANGIMALHAGHIIHRDLKPSNVLVDDQGKVTILDFGLVVELTQRTDQTISIQASGFAGTPLYAAPEQILGKSAAASDWYALGVMIYEALTGERPFSGSPMEVLDQKRSQSAAKLTDCDDLPPDLAQLTDHLLQQQPEDRPGPLEIAKALSLQVDSVKSESVEKDFLPTVGESGQILIGREQQLAELDLLKRKLLEQRKPLAVFITGKSGEGKTSLAEKFLTPLRLGTEVLVLSGRCYDRESVPFKAIDSIIDPLVAYLRGKKDAEVEALLPDDIRMLAHLFPVMGRVKSIADRSRVPIEQLDAKQIRYRAFHALRELLRNIGTEVPIVMFIDDLQWGDGDSAEALHGMFTSAAPPAMLFVGSYRRDEAEDSTFLQDWEQRYNDQLAEFIKPNVVVGPLTQSQCLTLMVVRFGDSELIRRRAVELFESTGGNPYFLDQLIDCFDPDTGSFTPVPLHEVIATKLGKLSADAEPLLRVIAVSGQPISMQEAAEAADVESAFSTITHMRTERLVRLIGSKDSQIIDTYHDKVRETVLEQLTKSERRRLHRTFGEVIESVESIEGQDLLRRISKGEPVDIPARVFDLAYHFGHTEQGEKSLVYSILAAEQATGQFALMVAIDHYQAAEKSLELAKDTVKYRVKFGFGSVLLLGGRYAKANQKLAEAIRFASDPIEAIRAKSQQADIVYKTGSLTQSIAACELLLKELGLPVPRSGLTKSLGVYRVRLVRLVHEIMKGRPPLPEGASHNKNRIRLQLLLQLAYPCLFHDRATYLWAVSIAKTLAVGIGERRLLATVLAFELLGYSWHCCDFKKVKGTRSKAIQLSGQLDDVYCESLLDFHYSAALLSLGQYKDAAPGYKPSLAGFERVGDVWRKNITLANVALYHAKVGNFAEAQRLARSGFETAIVFGQNRLAELFLVSWINSTGPELPLTELMSTFERVPDDLMIEACFKAAECRWLLKNGRTKEALNAGESAIENAERLYAPMGIACSAFPVCAHALREHAHFQKTFNRGDSLATTRSALKAAKKAVRITRKSTYDLPYALRELAINYVEFGKLRKAHRHIAESCEVAQRQGAKYEYAQSLLVCANIGKKLGLPDAQQQIEEAEASLAEFERQMELATRESFGRPVENREVGND